MSMCIVWYIARRVHMQEATGTSDAGREEANVEGVADAAKVSSGQSGWFLLQTSCSRSILQTSTKNTVVVMLICFQLVRNLLLVFNLS